MKLCRILLTVFTLLAGPITISAQNVRDRVADAVELMDNGDVERSIAMLDDVLKSYPEDYVANYELGYAYYLREDYARAVRIFSRLSRNEKVDDRLYQMWGNSCDMHGKSDKAVKIYRKGLAQFPESGCLRMELGTMALNAGRYDEALGWYEQGIAAAPQYPTNYSRAAIIYLSSPERVWGMIYGELFMNMVCNGPQNLSMSRYLAEAYAEGITASKNEWDEDVITIDFSKNNELSFDEKRSMMLIPYGVAVYEPTLGRAVVETGLPPLSVGQLCEVRRRFLDIYFDEDEKEEVDLATLFPNLLFDRQRKLELAGHLEAYSRWVLRGGDEAGFYKWCNEHFAEWQSFVDWFGANEMIIDAGHCFHSGQYVVDLPQKE